MTIVVGYLPTPEGMAAVTAAIEEAQLRGSRLVVLNTGNHGDYNTTAFASAHDLDALDERLAHAGIEHEIRQPTSGRSVSEELIDAAESEAAEMLVIGLRKRSPLGKLVMGSTAQEVLLDAPCRVLAVKS